MYAPPGMSAHEKIVSLEQLPAWREALREAGQRLVATNGCFDLLHAGHVTYLEQEDYERLSAERAKRESNNE